MAGEVNELKPEANNSTPVTQQDVDALKRQRALLVDFVSSQMKEADFSDSRSAEYGEGDYGVIPGTKKKTLFKPGAEKLLRLFGLGVRVRQADKDIDRHSNFAFFTYRAEVYHMKTQQVIAECEGSANSQEVKYKERTVWRSGKNGVRESVKEETPICDVLNTLMKMAQKRAIIGATIMATAASDYFHQDIDDETDAETIGMKARVEKPEEKDISGDTEQAPACCGKPMMISKYADKATGGFPWYCVGCRKTVART